MDEDRVSFESKVVMLGDTGIGKTSISIKFVKGNFAPNLASTVGASYLSKTMYVLNEYLFAIYSCAWTEA